MPPPSPSLALTLTLLPEPFFVIKSASVSPELLAALAAPSATGFLSVTRTPTEISIAGELGANSPPGAEAKWRAIRVRGPMEHSLTGVLAALSAPLAVAGVPIFALSTWDTDYVLVPIEKAEQAMAVLVQDGWLTAPWQASSQLS